MILHNMPPLPAADIVIAVSTRSHPLLTPALFAQLEATFAANTHMKQANKSDSIPNTSVNPEITL
jgi:hypothetical protein